MEERIKKAEAELEELVKQHYPHLLKQDIGDLASKVAKVDVGKLLTTDITKLLERDVTYYTEGIQLSRNGDGTRFHWNFYVSISNSKFFKVKRKEDDTFEKKAIPKPERVKLVEEKNRLIEESGKENKQKINEIEIQLSRYLRVLPQIVKDDFIRRIARYENEFGEVMGQDVIYMKKEFSNFREKSEMVKNEKGCPFFMPGWIKANFDENLKGFLEIDDFTKSKDDPARVTKYLIRYKKKPDADGYQIVYGKKSEGGFEPLMKIHGEGKGFVFNLNILSKELGGLVEKYYSVITKK